MSARRKALALSTLLGLGFGLAGDSFASTFDRPYAELESALLQRLELEAPAPGAKPVRAWIADRGLAECLGVSGYLQVRRYEPGESLELLFEERYDIGSIGGRSLEIDLRRTTSGRAEVRVDYSDRAVGFLVIPFAYVSPGWIRQARIKSCLDGLSAPPKEADRIPRRPPRVDEPVCERMQGRACGPREALLPCQTASGQPLLCTCRGRWSCV